MALYWMVQNLENISILQKVLLDGATKAAYLWLSQDFINKELQSLFITEPWDGWESFQLLGKERMGINMNLGS